MRTQAYAVNGKKLGWVLPFLFALTSTLTHAQDDLAARFQDPPDSCRPGVYWYFMDGNRTREGMSADLESMRDAGIGNLVYLEVNVGVPRGPVDFLSDEWQELFAHACREAQRLGIEITLGSGPGWAGSGGPWVAPEQSMQHLVASSIDVQGPSALDQVLPRPKPREPYFRGAVSGPLIQQRASFYRDVAVLAFPTPRTGKRIADIDEKALYYRAPFSSRPGVKPFLPGSVDQAALTPGTAIEKGRIVEITDRLQADGRLNWIVPPGKWTIMRFGRVNNGSTTRPAPDPGFGFECDKFDAAALDAHFAAYAGKLIQKVGPSEEGANSGWTMLHIDSWEMGAQNWTAQFRKEFRRRRGYDLLPYLPVYTGRVVGSLELSERFLHDLRMTAQELVLQNHAGHLKELGRRHGLGLSIEPYDMNPSSDLDLGSVADVPMCEFWSEGFGFDTSYSCLEATSIAHTHDRPIVAAEAFTANNREAWKLFPGAVKNQGDWAFCTGINRFVYHTFAHKPQGRRPGMTMGPYGVHWDRGQTWWPMVSAYHRYITRCQFLLRQGRSVADICYLTPEGAPLVFQPPPSALEGSGSIRDRRGYNFDGCSPRSLIALASVRNRRVVFPGPAAYQLLILPAFPTMTPELLGKIKQLVESGATVVGPPPRRSPSLMGYPECDRTVASLAKRLWGAADPPAEMIRRLIGRGQVVWGGELNVASPSPPTPPPIEQARWVWYAEGNAAVSADPSTRYFRRVFDLPADKRVRSARVEITADNEFQAWVNGRMAARGDNFHTVYATDARELLKPGSNVLAVKATNGGDGPNPAGLIASLQVQYQDGHSVTLITDHQWRAARAVDGSWRSATGSSDGWTAVKELGPASMNPWRLKAPVNPCPDLYPSYEATARLMAAMGLPPDFEADGPIRYTHRQVDGTDIYFVANRVAEPVEAQCTFRVVGKRPELWDPVSGTVRKLPDYAEQGGRTIVPLRFEPHQSFFIVFHRDDERVTRRASDNKNFTTPTRVAEIMGPWDVSFDAEPGGPDNANFATLEDWTRRSKPSVKYYSGIATYRKTFDLPDSLQRTDRAVFLDLGVVHSLARVRLNGHDLGVVWCAPWRVDVTDAVEPKGNRLEIDVANLWPNRLIGDKVLPLEQRATWTNWNPYQPDSPLLPSGLLGPVWIQCR